MSKWQAVVVHLIEHLNSAPNIESLKSAIAWQRDKKACFNKLLRSMYQLILASFLNPNISLL